MDKETSISLLSETIEEVNEIKKDYIDVLYWLINNTEYDHKTELMMRNIRYNSEKLYNSIRDLHEYKENQYDVEQED